MKLHYTGAYIFDNFQIIHGAFYTHIKGLQDNEICLKMMMNGGDA